jgi:ribosomal protein L11 methyltransferase
MRGDGGVEQMEERVGTDEVQVFGVRMVLGSARRRSGNVRPIQTETCQVHELDLLPETKAVQATFEPVMIDRHNQEQGDERDERSVAGLIPSHFIDGYRADRSDDEQDETPTGECGTSCGAHGDHAVEFRRQACQRVGFRHRRDGVALEHSADLTGRGRVRQLSSIMKSEGWVDVQIRTAVDAAELLDVLADPVIRGGWEDQGIVHLYWPKPQWSMEVCARLNSILQALDPDVLAERDIRIEELPDQDWNRQWSQSVMPIRIGRRIVIRPSWESVALQPGDIEIVLDPKQAFGTGHHATTRMLLEWLEDLVHGEEFVLDVGAGSGILAMASLRLGAAAALGVECDPVAVDCARDYAEENGFGDRLEIRCGTLKEVDRNGELRPDLVLANLDRQALLLGCDELTRYVSHGARLLLSGILLDHEQEIVDAFSMGGATLVERREQEGWLALEMLLAESCEGVS